jgi:uncharacterized protein
MTAANAANLYIGLNLLLLLVLAIRVVFRRSAAKISIGTGGDADLEVRSRAHGNAAENIPAMMIALYALAAMGMPVLYIHILGGAFTFGRVAHAIGMTATRTPARPIGMILTWLAMLTAGAMLVVHALI